MGPFARAEEAREISEVNVVPLADVSLVLLIILLVLSPMMRQNMLHVRTAGRSAQPETLPPEELFAAPPAELVLVVGLNPDGLVVGSRRFSGPSEFVGYLKEEVSRRSDKKVFLSPHQDVPVGLVVNTLETIKSCGADSVALVQTEEETRDGQVRAAAPAP